MYQSYITQGYFTVKLGKPIRQRAKSGEIYEYDNPIAVVTGEGLIWLKGKYMPTTYASLTGLFDIED